MYNYKKERKNLIDKQIIDYGYIMCERCNKSSAFKFHVHHIVFRSEKPSHIHINNPLNLIIVCDTCHDEFHSNKGLRNDIVENRNLNKLFGNDILNK